MFLAGCGRNDVQVYRVAKEEPQAQTPAAQPAALPPGHPDMAGATPKLQWTLPAGWHEAPLGAMRVGSFSVPGNGGKTADVSIVPLGGQGGNDLDNVNRWRGQVGLGPVSADELTKLAQPVVAAGQPAQLYELAGENPGSGEKSRMLAVIQRREDTSWFFKMTGDDNLVAQQKPAFVEFLKSLSFPAESAQSGLPPSHPPIGAPDMVAPPGMATASSGPTPEWQVPAGWQKAAAGPFLVAKFTVSGPENAQANVNISTSAGEGGGLLSNVNRWRQQLGQGSLAEADLNKLAAPMDVAGGKATLVDMTGTDPRSGQKTRLIGVVVPHAGQTWFYKLMGSESVVAREKEAFSKFVQTAKYP